MAHIRNSVTAKQVFVKYADLALNNISMIESSTYVYMHEQSMKHISLDKKGMPRCYRKSPTAQDVCRPMTVGWPGDIGSAISCTYFYRYCRHVYTSNNYKLKASFRPSHAIYSSKLKTHAVYVLIYRQRGFPSGNCVLLSQPDGLQTRPEISKRRTHSQYELHVTLFANW